MDNLKHLYFLKENETYGMGMRYSIGQILYDLVTVPDNIHKTCELIRSFGCPRTYRPNWYMMKHINKIPKVIENLEFDDVIFLTNQLGMHLSLTTNSRTVIDVKIARGPKIYGIGDLRKLKHVECETITSNKTGNVFTLAIYYAPEI